MERMRLVFATITAGSFLLAGGTSRAEVRCEAMRLKPLMCVCGTVVDQVGEVVPAATVTILKNGTEIAAVETRVDGKFSFNELKAASYKLQAQAVGFRLFDFPIVVQNSAKKCKQALEIVLGGAFETCPSIRLVKR